ncbi:hypothetical protein RRG08_002174 [Elysia crispata]|uniref:Uncharacterized protein n=1 Tax=Elysia crispata TaxID=231223 RepID=A0AAE1DE02_9GAST|nr:hypothetical protein RRG08_002174 [Elysia crispata]
MTLQSVDPTQKRITYLSVSCAFSFPPVKSGDYPNVYCSVRHSASAVQWLNTLLKQIEPIPFSINKPNRTINVWLGSPYAIRVESIFTDFSPECSKRIAFSSEKKHFYVQILLENESCTMTEELSFTQNATFLLENVNTSLSVTTASSRKERVV